MRRTIFLLALVACGSPAREAGMSCTQDAECAAGLSCLALATQAPGGACTATAKACSKRCATDADCDGLVANESFKCFASCDATMFCGAVP
jgi:hypothetical protein